MAWAKASTRGMHTCPSAHLRGRPALNPLYRMPSGCPGAQGSGGGRGGEGEADLGPETSSCSPVPRAGAAEDRLTDVEPEADLVCPLLTGWTAPVSEPGAPPPPPAVLLETPVSQRAREPVPS